MRAEGPEMCTCESLHDKDSGCYDNLSARAVIPHLSMGICVAALASLPLSSAGAGDRAAGGTSVSASPAAI